MTSYRIYRIIKKYSYFSEGGPYLLSFPTCKKAMWVTWYWNFVQGLFYNRNDAVFAIRFSIVSFAINFISNDSFKGFNDLTSEPDRNKAPFSGMVRCCKMWQNENFNLKRSRKTYQSNYFSLPLKLNFTKSYKLLKNSIRQYDKNTTTCDKCEKTSDRMDHPCYLHTPQLYQMKNFDIFI